MNDIFQQYKASVGHSPLAFVLALLIALEVLTGGVWGFYDSWVSGEKTETVLKISEIDGPAIDSAAAMISAEKAVCLEQSKPSQGAWFFALLLFSVLLIANFAVALFKKETIEWVPEVLYVALALVAWSFLDLCHWAVWFPILLIKVSLLIFALYLYLYEKRNQGATS